MPKPGWMGSTGITDAGDPPEGQRKSSLEDFVQRGYGLHVRWRSHEGSFHAYVDLGNTATSHNFMAESMDEALAGLERYLESHASTSTGGK